MTHDKETVEQDSFEKLSKDMADTLDEMSAEHDLNVCYSMAISALDMHTSRSAALSALPPQEVSVQDMPATGVGVIWNAYGGLNIRCIDGWPEWCIEDYDGMHWRNCDPHVFAALRALVEGGE